MVPRSTAAQSLVSGKSLQVCTLILLVDVQLLPVQQTRNTLNGCTADKHEVIRGRQVRFGGGSMRISGTRCLPMFPRGR